MNVEIINVGTELLLGEIVNTNATRLQKMCRDLGFNVFYQSVVGDNPMRLLQCLELAFKRGADCVITTGGLGPTTDDMTKELSAKYLGLEMIYNQEEARKVEKKCRFITRLEHIPENNFKQAYFPQNAYILENLMGTTNGCVMSKDEKMIINLPGPPKELEYVMEHSLIPYLQQYKQETLYTYEYLTMFIGESRIDELLRDLINEQKQVSIALYAGEETVRIRLAVKATSIQEANLLMYPIQKEIENRLDKYILHDKDFKTALLKLNKTIGFEGEFMIQDEVLQTMISSSPDVMIFIEVQKEELGEVIRFTLNNNYSFEVPSFLELKFSYGKIEARLMAKLYQYMINQL